jgi:hypothetical protein
MKKLAVGRADAALREGHVDGDGHGRQEYAQDKHLSQRFTSRRDLQEYQSSAKGAFSFQRSALSKNKELNVDG